MNTTHSLLLPQEEPLPQRIAARAYALWEMEGCPEGAHLRHWLLAEAELLKENTSAMTIPDSEKP